MSKVSLKINKIKDKLDSISGLDGDYTFERILEIDKIVDKKVNEINRHSGEEELNGTIFEE